MPVAETFKLKGSLSITPAPTATDTSGNPTVASELLEQMTLDRKVSTTLTLVDDTVFPVDLSELVSVHALMIKTDQKVIATITTADGIAQTLPIDGFLVWLGSTSPITALSLTRLLGTTTTCRLILGHKA